MGEYDGGPCPRGFVVDLGSRRATDKLRYLELDHEHDLQVTCDLWRRQLPADFTSWWDGVRDPSMLCHLLFGVSANAVHHAPSVRFRCADCHDRSMPHYRSLRASV